MTLIETSRFSLLKNRQGHALLRKSDNKQLFFGAGPAEEQIQILLRDQETVEMYPGENKDVFNKWAAQYF